MIAGCVSVVIGTELLKVVVQSQCNNHVLVNPLAIILNGLRLFACGVSRDTTDLHSHQGVHNGLALVLIELGQLLC